MLAHPQLQIPKYIAQCSSHHVDPTRPKSMPSSNYYPDISTIVSSSLSPVRSTSPADNPIDDPSMPSPTSPQDNTGNANFEIVSQRVSSIDSVPSPVEIYDTSTASAYQPQAQEYTSASSARASGYLINSPTGLRNPDASGHYLSDSPSPVDVQQGPSLSQPSSAPPSQDRFPHILEPLYTGVDRTITDSNPNLGRSRIGQMDKYSGGLLDQRRMSEPVLSGAHTYHSSMNSSHHQSAMPFAYNVSDVGNTRPSSSMYYPSSSLQRGSSTGSLRDLRQQHYDRPSSHQDWKPDPELHRDSSTSYFGSASEDAVSPLQTSFGGGIVNSGSGLPYSPISENFYGPSPPGTGTSSSSAPLTTDPAFPHSFPKLSMPQRSVSGPMPSEVDRKNYSFIALPGNAVKKRPRRRYDEIERLYQCSWPDCTKAYGTLNHLNAHVTMQKHGPKRSPSEFKELRKKWRAAKKEAESQMAMSLRRSSFSSHHEDFDYGSRFAFSHSSQRSHSFHQSGVEFPSSLGATQSMGHSMHPISYSSHHRDDQAGMDHDPVRYGDIVPPSWQGSILPSRGLPDPFISSLPSHHLHRSQLPHLTITDGSRHHSVPMPPSPPRTVNQLPPNSTLLTPLASYQNQSFPLSQDSIGYSGDSYDCYEDNSRPGTGNASIGAPSSDELQDDQCF